VAFDTVGKGENTKSSDLNRVEPNTDYTTALSKNPVVGPTSKILYRC
jgi:hypothetical protein